MFKQFFCAQQNLEATKNIW